MRETGARTGAEERTNGPPSFVAPAVLVLALSLVRWWVVWNGLRRHSIHTMSFFVVALGGETLRLFLEECRSERGVRLHGRWWRLPLFLLAMWQAALAAWNLVDVVAHG